MWNATVNEQSNPILTKLLCSNACSDAGIGFTAFRRGIWRSRGLPGSPLAGMGTCTEPAVQVFGAVSRVRRDPLPCVQSLALCLAPNWSHSGGRGMMQLCLCVLLFLDDGIVVSSCPGCCPAHYVTAFAILFHSPTWSQWGQWEQEQAFHDESPNPLFLTFLPVAMEKD